MLHINNDTLELHLANLESAIASGIVETRVEGSRRAEPTASQDAVNEQQRQEAKEVEEVQVFVQPRQQEKESAKPRPKTGFDCES